MNDSTIELPYTSSSRSSSFNYFFFFNDTATTEIYTLSLHDALPISTLNLAAAAAQGARLFAAYDPTYAARSEEHTSELQSPCNLVCRLLLEKKKKRINQKSRIHRCTRQTADSLARSRMRFAGLEHPL